MHKRVRLTRRIRSGNRVAVVVEDDRSPRDGRAPVVQRAMAPEASSTGDTRAAGLAEPRGDVLKVMRHAAGSRDSFPFVQVPDPLVPWRVDQLVDVPLRSFRAPPPLPRTSSPLASTVLRCGERRQRCALRSAAAHVAVMSAVATSCDGGHSHRRFQGDQPCPTAGVLLLFTRGHRQPV